MYELTGKVAFVTGAGGRYGFGRAIASRLAREGADVAVTDILRQPGDPIRRPLGDWQGIRSVAEEIQSLGRRALALALDVRSAAEVAAAVHEALTALGHIDILVNNAGGAPGRDRVPVVDLFTQALALELAPFGTTVNAICPGVADTERIDYLGRTASGDFDERQRAEEVAKKAKVIPLGRLATPEDVAQVTAFLASAEAAYMTGQAINVSGGSIMH